MKKTVAQLSEFGLIERLRKKIPSFKNMEVGIGDDAAVLKAGGRKRCLLTTDLLVENVDFSFRSVKPEEVGRKALAINLSDIAAMGGIPEAALIGLVLPPSAKLSAVDRFYDGFIKLAREFQIAIAGGDLSQGPCWMAAVSIFGRVGSGKVLLRSSARPGDFICVTGSLGGSITKKHFEFKPRILEGQFLSRMGVHAMIDVSDGLLQDLEHLLEASGFGAQLWLEKVPVSGEALRLSRGVSRKALIRALTDGEDFELLFTIPRSRWQRLKSAWDRRFHTPIHPIGVVGHESPKISFFMKNRQISFSFRNKGYQHF